MRFWVFRNAFMIQAFINSLSLSITNQVNKMKLIHINSVPKAVAYQLPNSRATERPVLHPKCYDFKAN
ncbi:hypothetical protein ASG14_17470 [Pedobacter sp. Leaf194]|nr:hypothetical protein ASG14_17470 [Pedobacter sp. Leaf194]